MTDMLRKVWLGPVLCVAALGLALLAFMAVRAGNIAMNTRNVYMGGTQVVEGVERVAEGDNWGYAQIAMGGLQAYAGAKDIGRNFNAMQAAHAAHIATPQNLYHYTSADPAQIAQQGLKPGASGKVFTTPDGTKSPLQAQIDLALPPNRGLPGHLVEIDAGTLQKMNIQIPPAQQVGRMFNMPGGGTEVVFPHAIPPAAIRVVR